MARLEPTPAFHTGDIVMCARPSSVVDRAKRATYDGDLGYEYIVAGPAVRIDAAQARVIVPCVRLPDDIAAYARDAGTTETRVAWLGEDALDLIARAPYRAADLEQIAALQYQVHSRFDPEHDAVIVSRDRARHITDVTIIGFSTDTTLLVEPIHSWQTGPRTYIAIDARTIERPFPRPGDEVRLEHHFGRERATPLDRARHDTSRARRDDDFDHGR